jgi:hypothetical protein
VKRSSIEIEKKTRQARFIRPNMRRSQRQPRGMAEIMRTEDVDLSV